MDLRRLGLALSALIAIIALVPLGVDARVMMPRRAQLTAHEWGVWLVDRGVVTLEDLARESPTFVHRASGASVTVPTPVPGPRPGPRPDINRPPPTARKPVLYLRSPEPSVAVAVRVGFHRGTPWLFYPGGVETRVEPNPGLVFEGHVVPGKRDLQSVPRRHFFHDLRAASDSSFLAQNGEREAFIFYDGPSDVARAVSTRTGDAVQIRATADSPTVYVVAGGRFTTLQASPTATADLATIARRGDRVRTLERTLHALLVTHRLTPAEATALIRTWRPELVEGTHARVISIVPRTAYDAALPITITPYPSDYARVGVVIERL